MSDIKVTVDQSQLKELLTLSEKIKTTLAGINVAFSKEASSIKEVDEAAKKSKQVQTQTAKAWQDVTRIITNQNDALIRGKQVRTEETRSAKQRLIILNAEKTSYESINAALAANITKYQKLSAAERENAKIGKVILTSIKQQDAALKKLDAQMGRHQRNVGRYSSALGGVARSLMGAFGVVGGVYMFAQILTSSIRIVREFEKSNAELAAVLDTTRDQITGLTEDAIRLNRYTIKTADEVTKLQIAYARLGYSQEKIIAYTEGTINTSIALNSELDRTAELVGAIGTAYKVADKAGANQIMDQLVSATQNSSLNFERLETALPKVAGAAAAVNIPLSTLLARLSVIQDATLDASITGTSYRKILADMATKGLDYNSSLEKILVSENKVSAAKALFGQRAFVAAIALAENKEKVEELSKAYEESMGTAMRTATSQLDTFDAKIKLLQSSWQGLVVSSGETGFLGGVVTTITDALDILGGMDPLEAGVKRFAPKLAKLTNEYNALTDEIKEMVTAQQYLQDNMESGGSLGAHMAEIIAEWGNQQANLNKETDDFASAGLPQLEAALQNSTTQYERAIKQRDTVSAISFLAEMRQIEKRIEALNGLSDEEAKILADEEAKLKAQKIERQETLMAKILGIDSIEELTSDFDLAVKNIADKSKVSITDILEGNVKLKESFNETFSEATNSGRSYFETMAELQEQLGEQIQESTKTIFVDLFSSQVDDNLAHFTEAQESQKDILKQRLMDGLIGEEEYANKVQAIDLKVRQESAKAEKKKALFKVGIDTAAAVMKTFAEFGFPLGVAPAALVTGIGLAQAAAIQAKQIPKFDVGTENFPGVGWVAEKRPEIISDKMGNSQLITSPTLFAGSQYKGMKVVSGARTEKLRKNLNVSGFDDQNILAELQKQNSRPIIQNTTTPSGIMGLSKIGNNITIRIKRY